MTMTSAPISSALPPLVDVLLAEPLTDLTVEVLQARIAVVTPQVARLHGWLTAATGQLDQLTGGTVPDQDGRARTVAGWLADVQHSTPGAAGGQLRTARLLRELPLVTAPVLDGLLTRAQAAVLTRLVGRIEPAALVVSQPQLIEVAVALDPAQLGAWVAQLATHREPAFGGQQTRAGGGRSSPHGGGRRLAARHVPAARRGQRDVLDRPGTAGPAQQPG